VEKISILYVDDEENNLVSFKASFRRFFDVATVLSAEEGMSLLKKKEFQIIISDQRMPGSSGVEFLERVAKEHPQTIRILLTGYADIEAAINAINNGQIYKYISKPFDEQFLKVVIDNGYKFYQTNKLLAEKTQNLDKAREELDRFAYSTSHDLRAPLASILGIIQVAKLEKKYLEDSYFQMIELMAVKLDQYTRNVIEYYQNDKKDKQLKSVLFHVLADELIAEVKVFKDTSLIDFILNIEQEEAFFGDEFRIKLILNNLISNAFTYRDPNKKRTIIHVTISANRNSASISIEDNGIGMDKEHLGHIFEMFYRSSNDKQGFGLGLFIVNEAVNKLDGEISVLSTVGEGSCFRIFLPGKPLK